MSAVSADLAMARAAADAARAVPGVVDLSDGIVGEFATYGGGERLPGVRARVGDQPSVRLKLVVAFGRALPELTDEVRARVREAVASLAGESVTVDIDIVDVRVEDAGPDSTPTERGELTWQS